MIDKARRKPYRGNQDVSQSYNDGVVKIYAVSDKAESGYFPDFALTLKCTLDYQERRMGINRVYQARQNMAEIQRVIRVPAPPVDISTLDIAETENGKRYQIENVQLIPDVYPLSVDITLAKLEHIYPVESS